MGKAAGIWKKVKNLGKSLGGKFRKALEWTNENIIRPNKDLIHNLNNLWDRTGITNKLIDRTSDYVHDKTDLEHTDTTFKDPIKTTIDKFVDYSQNPSRRRYNENMKPMNNIKKEGRTLVGQDNDWD